MLSIKSDFKSGSLEEAIQPDGAAFILGVQWHPEKMCDSEERKKLFAAFVENAAAHL